MTDTTTARVIAGTDNMLATGQAPEPSHHGGGFRWALVGAVLGAWVPLTLGVALSVADSPSAHSEPPTGIHAPTTREQDRVAASIGRATDHLAPSALVLADAQATYRGEITPNDGCDADEQNAYVGIRRTASFTAAELDDDRRLVLASYRFGPAWSQVWSEYAGCNEEEK